MQSRSRATRSSSPSGVRYRRARIVYPWRRKYRAARRSPSSPSQPASHPPVDWPNSDSISFGQASSENFPGNFTLLLAVAELVRVLSATEIGVPNSHEFGYVTWNYLASLASRRSEGRVDLPIRSRR